MADAIAEHPDVDYAYSDQDRMAVEGQTHSSFCKPDWSPERLRHHMYTTHFSVLRRSVGRSRWAVSAPATTARRTTIWCSE